TSVLGGAARCLSIRGDDPARALHRCRPGGAGRRALRVGGAGGWRNRGVGVQPAAPDDAHPARPEPSDLAGHRGQVAVRSRFLAGALMMGMPALPWRRAAAAGFCLMLLGGVACGSGASVAIEWTGSDTGR